MTKIGGQCANLNQNFMILTWGYVMLIPTRTHTARSLN